MLRHLRFLRRSSRDERDDDTAALGAAVHVQWLAYRDARTGRRDELLRVENRSDCDIRKIEVQLVGAAAEHITLRSELPESIGPRCHRDIHIGNRHHVDAAHVEIRWRSERGWMSTVVPLSPEEILV